MLYTETSKVWELLRLCPETSTEIVRLWIGPQDGEGGGRNIFKRSLSASNSSMKRNDSLGDTAARSAGQENRPSIREKNITIFSILQVFLRKYGKAA
jgi:hypothetical protein